MISDRARTLEEEKEMRVGGAGRERESAKTERKGEKGWKSSEGAAGEGGRNRREKSKAIICL